MDQLRAMRAFLTVADEGGFAPAALRLGISAPAATRAVASLEDHLGARLFKRTTRMVRLTEAGERYYADCKRILAEILEAESTLSGAHKEPRGEISVTASPTFGRKFVTPILLDFLARHRQITARTVFVNHVVDLIEEGVDVAIRIANLPDSSLSAIRVGSVRRMVVASPDYLANIGEPKTPSDLMRMDAISFALAPPSRQWGFRTRGKSRTVRPPVRLLTDTVDTAVRAAIDGYGVARLLSYQIADALQSGRLVAVLQDFEPPPVPIHVVHIEGRSASARTRAFVDFAVERLQNEQALQG